MVFFSVLRTTHFIQIICYDHNIGVNMQPSSWSQPTEFLTARTPKVGQFRSGGRISETLLLLDLVQKVLRYAPLSILQSTLLSTQLRIGINGPGVSW